MPSLRDFEVLLLGPQVHTPIIGGNSAAAVLHAGIVLLATIAMSYLAFHFAQTKGRAFVNRTRTKIDDSLLQILSGFEAYFGVLLGTFLAWKLLILPTPLDHVVRTVLIVLATIGGAGVAARLASEGLKALMLVSPVLQKGEKAYPILKRFLLALIWVLAGTFLLSTLGINVTSIVAGLGIGGLAVALAGQETLANFFGSLAVLSDRPFAIGDLVEIDGKRGTVEDIGMRSTRIRLVNGPLLTIPNKHVAESIIENRSRRSDVRVDLALGFVYETSTEEIENARAIITRVIRGTGGVSSTKAPWVHFTEFGPSSLTIAVTYWIPPTEDWDRVLDIRHTVNVSLKRELGVAGLQFAYPTQLIYHREA